jgi:hypothetical protein
MKFTDAADAPEAKAKLEALVGEIPQIKDLTVGLDVVRSEASFDLCLVTTHTDLDELRGYQQHPAHLEVAGWLKAHLAARAVVDTES